MADSWARQHGEPALWHARFVIYRDLGPDRTIEAAYRVAAEREGLRSARPGSGWYGAAQGLELGGAGGGVGHGATGAAAGAGERAAV